jgi:hypothetical protein
MSKSVEIPNVRPPKLPDEWVKASSASGSNADQPSTAALLAAPEELPGSEDTAKANAPVPEPFHRRGLDFSHSPCAGAGKHNGIPRTSYRNRTHPR